MKISDNNKSDTNKIENTSDLVAMEDSIQNIDECNENNNDITADLNIEDNMSLAMFIKDNYRGSRIVSILRSSIFISGEVIDGFKEGVSTRVPDGRTLEINSNAIDLFY